jgi:hypothetical protein
MLIISWPQTSAGQNENDRRDGEHQAGIASRPGEPASYARGNTGFKPELGPQEV